MPKGRRGKQERRKNRKNRQKQRGGGGSRHSQRHSDRRGVLAVAEVTQSVALAADLIKKSASAADESVFHLQEAMQQREQELRAQLRGRRPDLSGRALAEALDQIKEKDSKWCALNEQFMLTDDMAAAAADMSGAAEDVLSSGEPTAEGMRRLERASHGVKASLQSVLANAAGSGVPDESLHAISVDHRKKILDIAEQYMQAQQGYIDVYEKIRQQNTAECEALEARLAGPRQAVRDYATGKTKEALKGDVAYDSLKQTYLDELNRVRSLKRNPTFLKQGKESLSAELRYRQDGHRTVEALAAEYQRASDQFQQTRKRNRAVKRRHGLAALQAATQVFHEFEQFDPLDTIGEKEAIYQETNDPQQLTDIIRIIDRELADEKKGYWLRFTPEAREQRQVALNAVRVKCVASLAEHDGHLLGDGVAAAGGGAGGGGGGRAPRNVFQEAADRRGDGPDVREQTQGFDLD